MRRLSFAPRPLTLSQAADAYLGYCEAKGLSPGTLSHYRAAFQRLREFLSDDTDVRTIETPTLRDFCRHMLDGWPQHVGRPLSGKGLSPKTVRNTVVAMRTFFAFLVQEDYRQENPALALQAPRVTHKVIETFSADQVRALLRQPDRKAFTGLRDYAMMLALLDTGLRISELLGLLSDDVDWQQNTLTVMGKGAKQRQVPFGAKVRLPLWRYAERRGQVPGQSVFFVSVYGERLKVRTWARRLEDYGRRAKVEGVRVSPHTFRHTFAKFWILNGGDAFSLQRILGHTTLDMVRRYVNLAQGDVARQHRRYSPVDQMALPGTGRRL